MPPAPCPPEDVLEHVPPGADVIVPMANGEPVALLDALEANQRAPRGRAPAPDARAARAAVHPRRVRRPRLRHVSYFLVAATREAYWDGGCDLVPNHFSEMPGAPALEHALLARARRRDAARPPRLLSARARTPSTSPRSSAACRSSSRSTRACRGRSASTSCTSRRCSASARPSGRSSRCAPAVPDERDEAIAARIVERIPDGATLQVGIGGVPNAVLAFLRDHRDLGIHTELLSDGVVDLVERGVVTGTRKQLRPHKVVATFALGTQRLYDWLARQRGRRDAAGRLGQRPAGDRARARLRVDQRHHRGRPLRPVRLRDDRRALLVLQRRPGRLRARRDVLRGRAGVHRPALDDQRRAAAASACG